MQSFSNGTFKVPIELRSLTGALMSLSFLGILGYGGFLFSSSQVNSGMVLASYFTVAASFNISGLGPVTENSFAFQVIFSYIPIVLGMAINPFWALLTTYLSIVSPFIEMHTRHTSAKPLLSRLTAVPPPWSLVQAFKNRRYLVGLIASCGLLSNFLAVSLSGLFESTYPVIPQLRNFTVNGLGGGIISTPQLNNLDPQEVFYLSTAMVTLGSPSPKWTTNQYYFQPFAFDAGFDRPINTSDFFQGTTRGIGATASCRPIDTVLKTATNTKWSDPNDFPEAWMGFQDWTNTPPSNGYGWKTWSNSLKFVYNFTIPDPDGGELFARCYSDSYNDTSEDTPQDGRMLVPGQETGAPGPFVTVPDGDPLYGVVPLFPMLHYNGSGGYVPRQVPWCPCNKYLVSSFVRLKLKFSPPASPTPFIYGEPDPYNGDYDMTDFTSITVVCETSLVTAMFNVTVTPNANVVSFSNVSEFEAADPYLVNTTRDYTAAGYSLRDFNVLREINFNMTRYNNWLKNIYNLDKYDFRFEDGIDHAGGGHFDLTNQSSYVAYDWFTSLLASRANSTVASFPSQDTFPEASRYADELSEIYRMVFAVALSLQSELWNPATQPGSIPGAVVSVVHRVSMSQPMFILSSVILAVFAVVTVVVYARRFGRFLPFYPTTLGSIIALTYASSALDDFAPTASMTNSQRAAYLNRLGHRYFYGWEIGRDGIRHLGVHKVLGPRAQSIADEQPISEPSLSRVLTMTSNDADNTESLRRAQTSFLSVIELPSNSHITSAEQPESLLSTDDSESVNSNRSPIGNIGSVDLRSAVTSDQTPDESANANEA